MFMEVVITSSSIIFSIFLFLNTLISFHLQGPELKLELEIHEARNLREKSISGEIYVKKNS